MLSSNEINLDYLRDYIFTGPYSVPSEVTRSWNWDQCVDALEGQGVLGEVGDGQEGFCEINIAVSEGADDGAEDNSVVSGGFHFNDHGWE